MLLNPVSGDIVQGASTQLTKRPVAFRHNDSQRASERWFKGPAFLMKPEQPDEALPEDDQEIKSERTIFTLTLFGDQRPCQTFEQDCKPPTHIR